MITDEHVFHIIGGNIQTEKSQKDNTELIEEIAGDIDLSNIGYKVLIVYVNFYYHHSKKLYTLAIINKFSCQMTETNILKFSDEDYWSLANVIMAAINQAHVIFIQKLGQAKIPLVPIGIPTLKQTYEKLKTGLYSLWN